MRARTASPSTSARRSVLLGVLILLAATSPLLAGPGSLELTFGTGGLQIDLLPTEEIAFTGAFVSSFGGSLVLAAGRGAAGDSPDTLLLQFRNRHTGQLIHEVTTTQEFEYQIPRVPRILEAPNGELWVGLSAYESTDWDFGILRFNNSGLYLGTTWADFSTTAGATHHDFLRDLAFLPDGRAVAVGLTLPTAGGSADMAVALFDTDGSLVDDMVVDVNFGGNENDIASAVAVDSQGRIVMGGSSDIAAGVRFMSVVRLFDNLTVDLGFGNSGVSLFSYEACDGCAVSNPTEIDDLLTVGEDIYVLGDAVDASGPPAPPDVVVGRIGPNGWPDRSFGTWGWARIEDPVINEAAAFALDPFNQRIVVLSRRQVSAERISVARFTLGGHLDPAFGSGGVTLLDVHPDADFESVEGLAIDGPDAHGRVGAVAMFGYVRVPPPTGDLSDDIFIARLEGDSTTLFEDGFETGDTTAWSATVP